MNNAPKANRILGKFQNEDNARSFSNRTAKASTMILGDDGRYWVTNLRTMENLINQGYEAIITTVIR